MLELSIAEEARIYLHARLLRCPLGNNPADCPLHEIRLMPLEERIAWLDAKSDDEAVALYRQHNACVARKLAGEG